MKELSTEEKAKRYDEVIEKATALYKAAEPMSGCNVLLETVFPELKESEDERIRKEIIDFATKANNGVTSILANNYDFNKWLVWLEKQGEKKPIEPQQDMLSQEKYAKAVDECVYGEQNPAWSKEDDGMLHGIIAFISTTGCDVEGFETWIDWLKSLKYRVQPQPKPKRMRLC